METFDLPYNDCYAVISAGWSYNFFKLTVNVRNTSNSAFSDNFELTTNFWYDKANEVATGDGILGLDAHGSILPLHETEKAVKVLRKYDRKRRKGIEEHGQPNGLVDAIITNLKAVGCKEVRIYNGFAADAPVTFPGWDKVKPIKLNAVGAGRIGHKLTILDAHCLDQVERVA